MKNILVLAPHADDMEFGCGGTIKKLSEEGCLIEVLVFSTCAESLPNGFCVQDIKDEQVRASEMVGVQAENITVYDFPVRRFNECRQEILEILVEHRKAKRFDLVFTPSRTDCHQDHACISSESIRAFKDTCLLGYELPWNDLKSSHNFYQVLQLSHLDAKLRAIDCFESQKHRAYGADLMKSLAEIRGMQVKKEFAEVFEVIRWVER